MSLLNFDRKDKQPPRDRKSLKLVLGVGALVGVIALGSTLAASINLNGGGPVEFGQGVAQTTACDSQIIVTPYSSFDNSYGVQEFVLSSIEISDIANACAPKRFQINIYGNSDNPLNSDGKIEVDYLSIPDLSFTLNSDSDYSTLDDYDLNTDNDGLGILGSTSEYGISSFTITDIYDGNDNEIPAEDILKITIETLDTADGVFTYAQTSFDWLVLAAGKRSTVEAETPINEPTLHHGSYWYNTPNVSRGFSLDAIVSQNGCDAESSNTDYRLCWHIFNIGYWMGSGYRAGANTGGSTAGQLVRAIYTADDPGYYPIYPQINVLKSDLTDGGWTRCYYGDYSRNVTNAQVATCTGTYVLYAGGYPDPTP
jgi:hypothetical protein